MPISVKRLGASAIVLTIAISSHLAMGVPPDAPLVQLAQANASCFEWDVEYEGHDLPDTFRSLGHMVGRPFDCQRGCAADAQCQGWTYKRREGGCFYKSSDVGRTSRPPLDDDENNWVVSGAKHSRDCEHRGIDKDPNGFAGGHKWPCYEYNVAYLFSCGSARSHYRHGTENVIIQECHRMCYEVPGCRGFSWRDAFPRDGKIKRGVCFLCGKTETKICQPGAVSGWVEGRDCGAVPGTSFPPAPLPPFDQDGLHLRPADASLYHDLPTDPDAWGLGKNGTSEEISFHRGDLGVPSFLTGKLHYAVRTNEYAVDPPNCGCYHLGLTPDPNTSTVLQSLPLLVFPPEHCQKLCQMNPRCEAFSSVNYKCVLWSHMGGWAFDQVEPISVSGPKWCLSHLISRGYVCDVDHFRARFTSLSLLVLRIPNTQMAYGQACQAKIDGAPLVILLTVCLVVLVATAGAVHTRKRNGRTVVWRVVTAVLAALGCILHVVFVASLYQSSNSGGVLFWLGCSHYLFNVLFNAVCVVLYNLQWVSRHPFYRTWYDGGLSRSRLTGLPSASKITKTSEQDAQQQQQQEEQQHEDDGDRPIRLTFRRAATFHGHPVPPRRDRDRGRGRQADSAQKDTATEASRQEHWCVDTSGVPDTDNMSAYWPSIPVSQLSSGTRLPPFNHPQAPVACSSFLEPPIPLSQLSSDTVFPPFQHPQAPQLADSSIARSGSSGSFSDYNRTFVSADESVFTGNQVPPRLSESSPCFLSQPYGEGESGEKAPQREPDLENCTATTGATASRGAGLSNKRSHTDDLDDEMPFGGGGLGLVIMLFCSFFAIGVLHLCWSHLVKAPFFAIPVKAEAFGSLELLSLVGTVPILAIQLLTVFLSGGTGWFADSVPQVTLAAMLLSSVNTGGLLVRRVRGRCGKGRRRERQLNRGHL
ncbi:unnamed protein product [Vitrella brassicaformis CCMP3155]|uniref:Apple domain-containing protein n=3 Tax=Vitrella brassicaformis TaxID=1169539 RepID=A0A0G4GA99_VITBC|nr:unnamed protein product [Vitrella brassicaformis CCMP3155]|eukprot:CEM25872.1 unnamed protein product [Vitrella brassicaformis CCMP3155]